MNRHSTFIACVLATSFGTIGNATTFTGTNIETLSSDYSGRAEFSSEGFQWSGDQHQGMCERHPLLTSTGGDGDYDHLDCTLDRFARADQRNFDLHSITLSSEDNVQVFDDVPEFMPELRALAGYYSPIFAYDIVSEEDISRYNQLGSAYVEIEKDQPFAGGERFSVLGYRNGAVVAEQSFGANEANTTIDLTGFTYIDEFAIDLDTNGVLLLWNHYGRDFGYGFLSDGREFCQASTCLQADIASFEYTIAPVPLPAGAWLLAIGLVSLVAVKRRAI